MIKAISKESFLKESMTALDNMLESLKEKPSLNIVEQFSNSAKAYFNIENRESRIIVPMDSVETYDSEMHKAELLSVVALYMMAGNGIELVKNIEGLGEYRYE